jgi:hypothetical protein
MDVRFGAWNVRSLYRASSLMMVVKEQSRYKLVLSDGTEVVPNQQANIHFCIERGMRIRNHVQVFVCIRESYQ